MSQYFLMDNKTIGFISEISIERYPIKMFFCNFFSPKINIEATAKRLSTSSPQRKSLSRGPLYCPPTQTSHYCLAVMPYRADDCVSSLLASTNNLIRSV